MRLKILITILLGLIAARLGMFAAERNSLPFESIVQIKCVVNYNNYDGAYGMEPRQGWQGSGVFIKDDLILTAGHIVHRISDANVITIDGVIYKAKSWYLETEADLGFIEVETEVVEKTLRFSNARLGQEVWAYGNPLGVFPVLTKGIVSATEAYDDFSHTKDMVMTDAAINGGNSGCPLMSRYGSIVGICSWGYTNAQGMSYFVRAEICELALEKYLAIKALENAN